MVLEKRTACLLEGRALTSSFANIAKLAVIVLTLVFKMPKIGKIAHIRQIGLGIIPLLRSDDDADWFNS